ncbi:MAG TPA: carboxypeptidase-like regulatory domain-containing protein [Cyclobacteriaceae bacterium]|nr:carboxypeptidase-like regulatory domain-containing protein [Cyclobacteriaceae bacterium]
MLKRHVLFLLLLISGFCAFAQNSSVITGRLVDEQSGEPVPFATVKLQNLLMGVVSNANGDFQIPSKYRDLDEFLVISCIGYVTRTIPLKELNTESLNVIRVKQSVTVLESVTVRSRKRRGDQDRDGYQAPKSYSAERIVALAIKAIKVNYPQDPYSYIGYYRDYQLKDTSYINLNEAIVEIFDRGFSTNDQTDTQLSLFEYRKNNDFPRDSAASVPYDNKPSYVSHSKNKYIPNAKLSSWGGNELSILRLHDAIRNNEIFSYSFVNVFNKEFVQNHYLKLEGETMLDTIRLYTISFESRYAASGPRNFAKGKLYIEKNNFAIHKIEYAAFNKTMRETQLMYDIKVEYVRNNGKMCLNYISFNNGFRLADNAMFKVIDIVYDKAAHAFILDFNTEPEEHSVQNKENYKFSLRGRPINMRMAVKTGARKVFLYPDDASAGVLEANANSLSSALKYEVANVRDVNNRQLDVSDNNTIFQFRELFVQRCALHDPVPTRYSLMKKDVPLEANQATAPGENVDFWMNSPLKTKGGN